jgi:hypothetical protein
MFNKYFYGDQVKEEDMGRGCRIHRRMKNTYKILVWKPEGKRLLGRA